jgi:hypothetical protein
MDADYAGKRKAKDVPLPSSLFDPLPESNQGKLKRNIIFDMIAPYV